MKRLAFIIVLSNLCCMTAACSLSPMPNCKEGEFTCEPEENGSGGALFLCKEDNNEYIKNCAFGCHPNGSECASPSSEKCNDGTATCTDEHTLRQCENGIWKLYECKSSCANDTCTIHECTDAEPVCSDGYTVVSCIEGKIQKTECTTKQKCDEGSCIDAQPTPSDNHKEICDDGNDNDGDGWIDCNDPECTDLLECKTDTPTNPQDPKEICDDNKDNDDNGLVDCNDPECIDSQECKTDTPTNPQDPKEICDDKKDNNENGLVDCDDPECYDSQECKTNPQDPKEICDDKKDNNENGLVDCDDPECYNDKSCQPKEICDDGKDNDNNGLSDCNDPACKDLPKCIPIEGCDESCQNCKMEGNTFTICSGKGILEYQKLTDEERKQYMTLVFKGEINLDDAGKTTTPGKSSETTCEWADWTPLKVPNEIKILGDKAHIFYKNSDNRCTLPSAFFNEVWNADTFSNIHFDYDYYGTTGAVLINYLANTTLDKITYTGSITNTGSNISFALIDKATGNHADAITINLQKVQNKNTTESNTNGMDIAGFIAVSEDNTITNLELNIDEMSNYTKGGVGGIIAAVRDHLTLEHIKIYIKNIQVAEEHNYIGGLIQNISNRSDIKIDDAYIQIDQIKRNTTQTIPDKPGSDDYGSDIVSGAMIGKVDSTNSNYSFVITNCVLHVKEISHTLFSGIIGDLASQPYKLNNIVVISDSALHGGILGNDIQLFMTNSQIMELTSLFGSSIQNVVIVSPATLCDDMIVNHSDVSLATIFASFIPLFGGNVNISSSFFYNSAKCPKELFMFKEYNTKTNTDTIINLLQTSSSASWELRQVNMGKYTLEVPLFKAAGVWAN